MEKRNWEISCTKEEFEKIKTDDRFLGLLTLSIVVNALRFCQKAVIDAKGNSSPSGVRTRIHSFLFASSILYEGFLLIAKLSKRYKDLDSFKNGFATLLRDKSVREFRTSILKRARNKFVFHFDEDVQKESIKTVELQTINFASGYGNTSGETYFNLADEIAINYLLQPKENESNDSLKKRYIKILQEALTIMDKFSFFAEELMADVLKDMGFVAKAN
jgi:hypothetical protein